MELSPRKQTILAAVVDSYIASGEPVGSKALCDILDLNLSSATLRNELSDLCSLGFLSQPHTSAGRIPTCSGYKFYIKNLMQPSRLMPEIRLAIDSTLQSIAHTPEQMPSLACQILADLTGLPSFCATLTNEGAKVKRVRIIPMGKRTLLVVIISTDGIAKSRIVLSDCDVDESLLSLYSNICKMCIVGHRLYELNTAYLQSIVARVGEFSLPIMPLLYNMFEIIGEMFEPQFTIKGETNLFSGYNRQADAVRLGELVSSKETVLSLISRMDTPSDVIFSDDYSRNFTAPPSAIILAKYAAGNRESGRVGIIGPARMSYRQMLPYIEYFAKRLGILMTKAMRDMED